MLKTGVVVMLFHENRFRPEIVHWGLVITHVEGCGTFFLIAGIFPFRNIHSDFFPVVPFLYR